MKLPIVFRSDRVGMCCYLAHSTTGHLSRVLVLDPTDRFLHEMMQASPLSKSCQVPTGTSRREAVESVSIGRGSGGRW